MKQGILLSASFHIVLCFILYFAALPWTKPDSSEKKRESSAIEVNLVSKRVFEQSAEPSKKRIPSKKPSLSKMSMIEIRESKPAEPAKAAKPAKPAKAAKPAEPAKPAKAAKPAKVSKKFRKRPRVKKRPRPVSALPDFGSSLAERVKSSWTSPLDGDGDAKHSPVADEDQFSGDPLSPSLSLPRPKSLESHDLEDFKERGRIPSGMRVAGAVPSSAEDYLARLKARLKSSWIRPSIVDGTEECELRFAIDDSGRIFGLRLSKPSSNETFNTSVIAAVERLERFEALPKDLGNGEREVFYMTFVLDD